MAVEDGCEFFVRQFEVAIAIKALEVIVGIGKDDLAEEAGGIGVKLCLADIAIRSGDPGAPAIGFRLAPGRESGDDFFIAAGIARAGIEPFQRGQLRGGQAVRRVTALAAQARGTKMAGKRIWITPSLSPHCLTTAAWTSLELVGRQAAARRRGQGLIGDGRTGKQMRPVVGRVAHRCRRNRPGNAGPPSTLAAAIGAALEIGMFRRPRIGGEDRLGRVGGLLQRAIAEIDLLSGMVERPAGIGGGVAAMAVIGACHGKAPRQAHDAALRYRAGETAIADLQVTAVPMIGIHSSKRISESAVGWAAPVTRQ